MEMIKDAGKKVAVFTDKHFWIILAVVLAFCNPAACVVSIILAFYTKLSEISDAVTWNENDWKLSYTH